MLQYLAAVAGAATAALTPPPNPEAPMEGFWEGTEQCAEHCCSVVKGKTYCQRTVRATLELGPGGKGTYSIDGLVISSEYRGDFAAGHVQSSAKAEPHGTFIAEANSTNLYGSWISFGSKRLFHWDFVRAVPPAPPPPPCTNLTTPTTCDDAAGCLWKGGACSSRIRQQVNVFIGGTKAPWGTVYNCFRVPSSVLLPNGDVVIFVESRIGTCGDQAAKDVTMKRSSDSGKSELPPSHPPAVPARSTAGCRISPLLTAALFVSSVGTAHTGCRA